MGSVSPQISTLWFLRALCVSVAIFCVPVRAFVLSCFRVKSRKQNDTARERAPRVVPFIRRDRPRDGVGCNPGLSEHGGYVDLPAGIWPTTRGTPHRGPDPERSRPQKVLMAQGP